jgi:hypothetical protein
MALTTGPAVLQEGHQVAVKSSAIITLSAPMTLLAARATAARTTNVRTTEDLIAGSSSYNG